MDKEPQQIMSPLPQLAVYSIVISRFVIQVKTTHVFVLGNGGRNNENLYNSFIVWSLTKFEWMHRKETSFVSFQTDLAMFPGQ